jgi:hypothetical protein
VGLRRQASPSPPGTTSAPGLRARIDGRFIVPQTLSAMENRIPHYLSFKIQTGSSYHGSAKIF